MTDDQTTAVAGAVGLWVLGLVAGAAVLVGWALWRFR